MAKLSSIHLTMASVTAQLGARHRTTRKKKLEPRKEENLVLIFLSSQFSIFFLVFFSIQFFCMLVTSEIKHFLCKSSKIKSHNLKWKYIFQNLLTQHLIFDGRTFQLKREHSNIINISKYIFPHTQTRDYFICKNNHCVLGHTEWLLFIWNVG